MTAHQTDTIDTLKEQQLDCFIAQRIRYTTRARRQHQSSCECCRAAQAQINALENTPKVPAHTCR